MNATSLGLSFLVLALTLGGCGDDGGGSGETGESSTGTGTGSATESMSATAPATMSGTMSTTDPTGDTETTGGSTGSTGDVTGDTTGGTAESSGSGSSESGGSSSTGTSVDNCDACGEDEVCVENQAQVVTYECQPLPAACEDDVDCECGMELCQDPFVACNDVPEPMHLVCICIAC